MELAEWILELEPVEQGYVRQCFKYWNGINGGMEPSIPAGMSKAKADILRYHCQALNNGKKGRRKVEESKPISFRWTDSLKRDLAFEAAEMDITLSEYVLRCVIAGRPVVKAFPDLSKNFTAKRLQL